MPGVRRAVGVAHAARRCSRCCVVSAVRRAGAPVAAAAGRVRRPGAGPGRRGRPGCCGRTGGRGRRRRWSPPVPARAPRQRQDHARRAAAGAAARARPGRGARGDRRALRRGHPAGGRQPLVGRPPFQDPHHTATVPSLVGGGSGLARPGAVSLAHRGVLFLDEAPEFAAGVLDALRQPLESGRLTLARSAASPPTPPASARAGGEPVPVRRAGERLHLPADGAPALPRRGCPGRCWTGSTCTSPVPRITRAEMLAEDGSGEPSADMAARVAAARDAGRGALRRHAVADQRRGPGRSSCGAAGRCRAGHRPADDALDDRPADRSRVRPGAAAGLDARRPAGPRPPGRPRGPGAGLARRGRAGGGMSAAAQRRPTTSGWPGLPCRGSSSRARCRSRRRCPVGRSRCGTRCRRGRARRPGLGRGRRRRGPRGRRARPAGARRRSACGGRLVVPGRRRVAGRSRWPLRALLDDAPPLALCVCAGASLLDVVPRSVRAVVGARAATRTACTSPTTSARAWPTAAATVVSGGAFGIDAAAHRGALAAGRPPTVAVLACGVDVAYPRGHDRLLARVAGARRWS